MAGLFIGVIGAVGVFVYQTVKISKEDIRSGKRTILQFASFAVFVSCLGMLNYNFNTESEASSFRARKEQLEEARHKEIMDELRRKEEDNEAQLAELYPFGFMVFAPYGDGFVHLPQRKNDKETTQVQFLPNWELASFRYESNNLASISFEKINFVVTHTNRPGMEMVDNHTTFLSIPLNNGEERRIWQSGQGIGVFLRVIDDDIRNPAFAVGIRKSDFAQPD